MVLDLVLHGGGVSGLKFSSWDGKIYCWAPKYLLPAAWPLISPFRRLTSLGLTALFKCQNTISVILLLTANTTETTGFSGLSCMHQLIFFHKRGREEKKKKKDDSLFIICFISIHKINKAKWILFPQSSCLKTHISGWYLILISYS